MTINNQLQPFLFPVTTKDVYFGKNGDARKAQGYKAIIRADTGKLISINPKSYKLVRNEEVITSMLQQLNELPVDYRIDNVHSYVSDRKMAVSFLFPDIKIWDGKSDIQMSLLLLNSYDGSTSIVTRVTSLRQICSNGLTITHVIGQFSRRHTSQVSLEGIKQQLETVYNSLPKIKEKVVELQNLEVKPELLTEVEEKMGKSLVKYIAGAPKISNQWVLFNIITYYISHYLPKSRRADYQMKLSRLFMF